MVNKRDRTELAAMLGAVDRMAYHMKKKLRAKARQGYTGGLRRENWTRVAGKLREHADRLIGGDNAQSIDVANLAMMLWVLGGEGKPEQIHWASTREGWCFRKDLGIDARILSQSGDTTVTNSAIASWPQNVTCRVCRQYMSK